MGEISRRLEFKVRGLNGKFNRYYMGEDHENMLKVVEEALADVARAISELEDKIDRQTGNTE